MSYALIYKPAKNAMQSGRAKANQWVLEMTDTKTGFVDPLMGWNGAKSTDHQVKIYFDTLEDAKNYAQKQGLITQITPEKTRKITPRNYGDNFKSKLSVKTA
jgi:hypothetical protein